MNAQDEQQWRLRVTHATAASVSFCKAQTCNNKLEGVGQLALLMVSSETRRRGQGALSMVSSMDADEGTGNM